MGKRIATILCLLALGASLGGCSKCGGFFWESGPRSCHNEQTR